MGPRRARPHRRVYRRPVRRPALLAVLALAALGPACGPGQDSTVVAPVPTTTSSPPTTPGSVTTATTGGSSPLEGAGTSPTSVPAVAGPAYLTAVRAARREGADRVVFEFDGGPPGYRVAYVARPVTEDGSGREVPVEGGAVLEVRMEQAAGARISGEQVVPTYRGPTRLRPAGTGVVVEAVRAGDFEGALTWVVGTRARAPFKVSTLTGPSRLVIDVASTP